MGKFDLDIHQVYLNTTIVASLSVCDSSLVDAYDVKSLKLAERSDVILASLNDKNNSYKLAASVLTICCLSPGDESGLLV